MYGRMDCCRLKMAIKSLVLLLLRIRISFPSLWFLSMHYQQRMAEATLGKTGGHMPASYGHNLEKEMAIASSFLRLELPWKKSYM